MKNLIIIFVLILFTVLLKRTEAQDTIIMNENYLVIDQRNTPESIEKMDKKTIVSSKKLKSFQNKLFSNKYKKLTESNYFETGDVAWKGGIILNDQKEEIVVEIVFLRNNENAVNSIIFLYLSPNKELPLSDRYYLSIEIDQTGKFIYCSNCLKNKKFEHEYLKIPGKIIDLVLLN
jgi:hypothetical protein